MLSLLIFLLLPSLLSTWRGPSPLSLCQVAPLSASNAALRLISYETHQYKSYGQVCLAFVSCHNIFASSLCPFRLQVLGNGIKVFLCVL